MASDFTVKRTCTPKKLQNKPNPFVLAQTIQSAPDGFDIQQSLQTERFIQAEYDIHVLNCLARRAFDQVVDHRETDDLALGRRWIDMTVIALCHILDGGRAV